MIPKGKSSVRLAGLLALALCGCTQNNQLMIRPADGVMTYCSPLDHVPAPGLRGYWTNAMDERCVSALEALGFVKAEDVGLAGGIYLTDDGRVLSSEGLAALDPHIPPQHNFYPPKDSGLEPGDEILAVNGAAVKKRSEIVPRLIGKPGQRVTVKIRRKNVERDVALVLKPWLESAGDIFFAQEFFFHFEYPHKIAPELN